MALTASRSLTHGRRAGAPLPTIPELDTLTTGHFKFQFRQSELTMVAGQPGSQKSGFLLWLVSKWNLPTLYFSADSSSYTVSTRLAAAYTGDTTKTVGEGLRNGAEGYYQDILDDAPARFCYDPNPTYETIEQEIDAWVELFDSYPQVIVVDNLMDVVGAGDSEFQANKDVLLELKTIARRTEACVVVLHHMSETGTDPSKPAPRKAVMGKVNQTPENILSVALDGDVFMVSVVKHRSGPGDATAGKFERLLCRPECNRFEPLRELAGWSPVGRPGDWSPSSQGV